MGQVMDVEAWRATNKFKDVQGWEAPDESVDLEEARRAAMDLDVQQATGEEDLDFNCTSV